MIRGTGCDLIEIVRFKVKRNKKEFLNQYLAPKEMRRHTKKQSKDCFLALCFAEKEAILKALGCGLHYGSYWRDIELRKGSKVKLSGFLANCASAKAVTTVYTARCYSKKLALALALIEE